VGIFLTKKIVFHVRLNRVPIVHVPDECLYLLIKRVLIFGLLRVLIETYTAIFTFLYADRVFRTDRTSMSENTGRKHSNEELSDIVSCFRQTSLQWRMYLIFMIKFEVILTVHRR